MPAAVFVIEDRHQHKREPLAIALDGFAQDAFFCETETLIQVACAEVVFDNIQVEAVRADFIEDQAQDLG